MNSAALDFRIEGYSTIYPILIVACIIALIFGIVIEDPEKDQPIYKLMSIISLISSVLIFIAIFTFDTLIRNFYYDPDYTSFSTVPDAGFILAIVGGVLIFIGSIAKKAPILNFNYITLYAN